MQNEMMKELKRIGGVWNQLIQEGEERLVEMETVIIFQHSLSALYKLMGTIRVVDQ